MIRSLCLKVICLAGLLSFGAAEACLHGPEGFNGKLSADAYRAVLFHSGEREELILFTNLEFDEGQRPAKLAWILALPSVPDGYSANIEKSLYDDAAALIPEDLEAEGPSFGGDDELDVTLIKVGPYQIHQVSASGAGAHKALNQWFKKNGFATKSEKEMKFFINKGYSYLCVQVDWKDAQKLNKAGEKGNTAVEGLPPLRISFKSDRPFVPLKFSSHQGTFDLGVMTFTKDPIDWLKSAPVLRQINVEKLADLDPLSCQNLAVQSKDFKKALKKTYGDIIKEKRLGDSKQWYFNAIAQSAVNEEGEQAIKNWKSDFYLELDKETLRAKVVALLKEATKDLDEEKPKLNQKAVTALKGLGEKAIPSLCQRLARSFNEYEHKLALQILKDYPTKLSKEFMRQELWAFEDFENQGGCFFLDMGEILLKRQDPRGIKMLVDRGITCWNQDDEPFGYKSEQPVMKRARALLEKYTGTNLGLAKELSPDDSWKLEEAWVEWFEKHEDQLHWDKTKKLFVPKK